MYYGLPDFLTKLVRGGWEAGCQSRVGWQPSKLGGRGHCFAAPLPHQAGDQPCTSSVCGCLWLPAWQAQAQPTNPLLGCSIIRPPLECTGGGGAAEGAAPGGSGPGRRAVVHRLHAAGERSSNGGGAATGEEQPRHLAGVACCGWSWCVHRSWSGGPPGVAAVLMDRLLPCWPALLTAPRTCRAPRRWHPPS